MREKENLEYYRERIEIERATADVAISPRVAQLHLELAERYEELLRLAELRRYEN